jgi:hypothetical protein
MKKFLLLLLTSYALLAEGLPQSITTTIKSIDAKGEITLSASVPEGISGIVVHNYGNGLSAITGSVITTKNSKAKLSRYSAILHENIPNIQTKSKVGDRVVLGNFYNNALLIAPNAKLYEKLTKTFKKTWIHPDMYALDFMHGKNSAITFDNLEEFAKKNQIGLVVVVAKEKLLIIDPISKKIIGQQPFSEKVTEPMKPFFARFEQIDTSPFGFSKVVLTDYYKAIDALEK